MTCVSWNDAQAFVKWLKQKEGKEYRLPTEAEWEYAARAGTQTARFWGDNPNQACGYANVADRTAKKNWTDWSIHDCDDGYAETAPVGSFTANAFGLHDMLGNVWEWCQDWYGNYPAGAVIDLSGAAIDSVRVIRGGSWLYSADTCRSAFQSGNAPGNRNNDLGFRVLAVPAAVGLR